MNLIPLSEYVLQEETKIIAHLDKEMSNGNDIRAILNFSKKVRNYTKFLRQPLTLGMFVPVDGEGEVLNYDEIRVSVQEGTETWDIWTNAKEKVFFKFQFDMNAENAEYFISTFETIEGLAFMYEPEFTPSALKLIGEKEQKTIC